MQHSFPQMQKLFDEQVERSRESAEIRPANDEAARDIASRFQTAFNQMDQRRQATYRAPVDNDFFGAIRRQRPSGADDDFFGAFQRVQQRAAPILGNSLRPSSYRTTTTTVREPGTGVTSTRTVTQRSQMPGRRVAINRETNPLETAQSRRHTHHGIREHIVQLARTGQLLLQHRLPMWESRIQHLLEQPGASPDQIAALFAAVEQANADIPVLQSVAGNAVVTAVQMQCVMRVLQDQYGELTNEIEEDRRQHPNDQEEIEEMDDEEEDDNELNVRQAEPLGGMPPGLIGLAAAMMGAATGMGNLDRMMNALGMPANFFDNVPVPMPESGLRHMPNVTYQEFKDKLVANGEEPNTECNFCLENFEDSDQIRCYPCCPRVAQHTKCLDDWLASHDTCIICKKKVADVIPDGGNNNSTNNNNNNNNHNAGE